MLKIDGQTILVDTPLLSGIIDHGEITLLRSKQTSTTWIDRAPSRRPPLQLLFKGGEAVDVACAEYGRVSLFQVTENMVEMRVEGWEGSGVIVFSEDRQTGELCIEPSAYSARRGLRSVRYAFTGWRKDGVQVIAPLWQGVRLSMDDPLIMPSWNEWPFRWEAGFVILEGRRDSLMLWTQDSRYTPKALSFDPSDGGRLALDTQAFGPIEDNLSAGGLVWRIGAFSGDWHAPASAYRQWLYGAYQLDVRRPWRPDWMRDLSLCVSWTPCDESFLDALACHAEPRRTLLHFPWWRSDDYDRNYPVYKPSQRGASMIRKARKMGYHIAPHANIMEIDPAHSAYPLLADFAYRDVETDRRLGWSRDEKGMRPVPMDNLRLQNSGRCCTMVKLHAAQPMWHSLLRESLQGVIEDFDLDCIFTDVSHVTMNLRNCLVNNQTPMEGVMRLQRYLAQLHGGTAIGGEGLNELTMQTQTFAQVHLFESYVHNHPGLDRTGGIDLNQYLWGDLCLAVGYHSLDGSTEENRLRLRIHREHGAIPTLACVTAEQLRHPPEGMLQVFREARER